MAIRDTERIFDNGKLLYERIREETPDEGTKLVSTPLGCYFSRQPWQPLPTGYYWKRLIFGIATNGVATFFARLIAALALGWAVYSFGPCF